LFFRADILIPIRCFQLEVVEKVFHRFLLHLHSSSFLFGFLCLVSRHEYDSSLVARQLAALLRRVIRDGNIGILVAVVQKLLRRTFGQLRFRIGQLLLFPPVAVGVPDGRRQAAVSVASRELLQRMFI